MPPLAQTDPRPPDGDCDEFFIGWLAMPHGYTRFLRRWVVPLLLAVFVIAVFLAVLQRSPGRGVWETDSQTTLTGLAMATPYPMLHIGDENTPGKIRTVLLVGQGKFGVAERLAPFERQTVRVFGTILHRDGRSILELSDEPASIELASTKPASIKPAMSHDQTPVASIRESSSMSVVNLRGEIIDPKCYLGAMKPGGGKTHKACAVLCLKGGIPPMFVTRNGDAETYYLLTSADGSPILDPILPFVGDPSEIRGDIQLWGDLQVLRIAPESIRRL